MNPAFLPFIFYLAGSLAFVIGTVIAMIQIYLKG